MALLSFPPHRKFDVIGIGRNSWDRLVVVPAFPKENSKIRALNWVNQAGGQVATTMVTLSRLGHSTRYLGKFGDDAGGRAVRAALAREDVDLSFSRVLPGVSNQAAMILVHPENMTRTVVGYGDPSLRVTADDFAHEAFTDGRILYVGGRHPKDVMGYVREARDREMIIAVDADSRDPETIELIELADIIFCPEEIVETLSGEKSLEKGLRSFARGDDQILCATQGSKGVFALHRDGTCQVEPPKVNVMDTTGAGDVFQGGVLAGLLQRRPLQEALKYGAAAAAYKCQKVGAQQGIPQRETLENFFEDS